MNRGDMVWVNFGGIAGKLFFLVSLMYEVLFKLHLI